MLQQSPQSSKDESDRTERKLGVRFEGLTYRDKPLGLEIDPVMAEALAKRPEECKTLAPTLQLSMQKLVDVE